MTIALSGLLCLAGAAVADSSLDVNGNAAMAGNFGLEVTADGSQTNAFVQDDTPAQEPVYSASFMFNVNNMTMDIGARHIIFSTTNDSNNGNRVVSAQLRRKAGGSGYDIRALYQATGGTKRRKTGVIDLQPNQAHKITIEFRAAASAGATDGLLRIMVDDATIREQTEIPTASQGVKNVKVGLLASSVDAGTVGSHYFDDFVSFRTLSP